MKRQPKGPKADVKTLTDAEWAIIEVVWRHEPCAAGTVQEALAESHGWAYSTVKTTMDRMVVKGLLASESIRNLQLFTSRISRSQAKRGEFQRLLRRAFGGSLTPMLQFLVDEQDLSEKEVRELRAMLDSAKKRKP